MTKILHTADLHLGRERPERWRALDAVLEVARDRSVDLLLVAGDLLDRDEDGAALRPRLRERFGELEAPVLLLPGNHDREAYAAGQDWGGNVRLLREEPIATQRVAGVRILGVPYPSAPLPFAEVRRRLEVELAESERPVVLTLHGTLIDAGDPRIQRESQNDEPEDRYFPVRTGELEGLPLAYVALGHYHQHDLRWIGETPVAYAGSSSPVGSHAWGPRRAVFVEIGGAREGGGGDGEGGAGTRIEAVRLPVSYRRRIHRWLTPFEEERELEALADELRETADPDCSMRVTLDGVLAGLDERALRDRVEALGEKLAEGYRALAFDLESVGLDPGRADLFRRFRDRLEERAEAEGEIGRRLRRRTLEIAARALKS